MLSPHAAAHVHSPRNAGPLQGATHIGIGGTPGEGPYVRLWLLISDGIIQKASYECNGCPSSIAASSVAAQLLTGRQIGKAKLLESKDLLLILGGLPEGKDYYADLAVEALQNALSTFHDERQPDFSPSTLGPSTLNPVPTP